MIDVLLLDAECRQTLACTRTYARGGLSVGTAACETHARWAPGLRSRWSSFQTTLPDYSTRPDNYVDALLTVVRAQAPKMVLAAHDGTIEALRARRGDLEHSTGLPLASEAALAVAVSKTRTLALATELGIAIPRSVRLSGQDDVTEATGEIGLPAVIKPVASWAEHAGSGARLSSVPVQSQDEARHTLDWMLAAGTEALMQEWLPGRREGVTVLYARDRFWARAAQVSHREWPVLGGVSVLCETIPLLTDITSQAEDLVRSMDLEGCSMVEFRRDARGRPVLMEVNPRMGGSVALLISAGVNVPQWLYDWKVRGVLHEIPAYRVGRRLRWLVGDIWNLKCAFDSQGQPDVPPRGRAALDFFLDFFNPANRMDILELGDMRPAISEMNEIVFSHALHRVRNFAPVKYTLRNGKVN